MDTIPTNTCEWSDSNGIECGLPVHRKTAYCSLHYGQVYQEGTALRKRKKDMRLADRIRDIESKLHEAYLELEEF